MADAVNFPPSNYYGPSTNFMTPLQFKGSIPQYRQQYYNLSNFPSYKKINCDTCNKYFITKSQYQKHIDEHVECPFPACNLSANIKVIDQHINHQHLLVNFDNFQLDDEAWIRERKRRFPSQKRAELRSAQQMERLKRGERISVNSKKQLYSDKTDQNMKNISPDKSQYGKRKHKKFLEKNKRKLNLEPILIKSEEDLSDSDSEMKFGVNHFKGTHSFYESTGELNFFRNTISTNAELNCSSIPFSDDEEEEGNWKPNEESNKISLNNALGSIMCAYGSDSENDLEEPDPLLECDTKINCKDTKSLPHNNENNKGKSRLRKKNPGKNTKIRNLRNFKPPKLRRPTLLQRLLSSEIKHERNMVLQCIKHIVTNNFFENATPDKS